MAEVELPASDSVTVSICNLPTAVQIRWLSNSPTMTAWNGADVQKPTSSKTKGVKTLGTMPVQMVAANESGSYMFSSYGRYTVMHRDGTVEERYFPTVRDLLDQKLPVTVAVRDDKDRARAEAFASSLRTQYAEANLTVEVLPGDEKDGAVVNGRHVSRFGF